MAKTRDPDAPTNKIRRHLHKHKTINREQIRAYGWRTSPGLAIAYLRQNGYELPLRMPSEGRYWEMVGFKNKKFPEARDLGPELEPHVIECMNCSEPFTVGVWPGEKPNLHQLCPRCKSHNIYGKQDKYVPSNTPPSIHSVKMYQASKTVVYKKGDEGFEERAAECTPIKDIKH